MHRAVIFIEKAVLPVVLADVHLDYRVVDFVQKAGVVLAHNRVEIFGRKRVQRLFVRGLAQVARKNRVNRAVLQVCGEFLRIVVFPRLVGKSVRARKIHQNVVLAASVDDAHGHAVVGAVVAAVKPRVVRLDGKHRIVSADRERKSETVFAFGSFPRGRYHIDFAAFQHGEHLIPRLVVADILEIQMRILRDKLKEFDAVAVQISLRVLGMVALKIEDPRLHRPIDRLLLRRHKSRRQKENRRQHRAARLACFM